MSSFHSQGPYQNPIRWKRDGSTLFLYMHVGAMIRDWLDRQGIPVRDFAAMIPCTRESAYRILSKPHLDTDLLLRISVVLRHDFFAECSRCIQHGYNVTTSDTA